MFPTLEQKDPAQTLGVEPNGDGEEVLVDVVHCDFRSDDLFAWLLAVPEAEFTLRYGNSENWRIPQPRPRPVRHRAGRRDGGGVTTRVVLRHRRA